MQTLAGLLGIVLGSLTGNVYVLVLENIASTAKSFLDSGLTCSPITAIGLGTTQCSNQVVCCQNNNFVSIIIIQVEPKLTFY